MPILVLLLLLLAIPADAQFGRETQSEPDTAWSAPCGFSGRRPTRCWGGLKFVFLQDSQKRPYPLRRRGDTADHVSYDAFVGKIAFVRNVAFSDGYWTMELVTLDSEILEARLPHVPGQEPQLRGLAWTGDLEYARRHYLERTVWGFVDLPRPEPDSANPRPYVIGNLHPREPGYRFNKVISGDTTMEIT